MFALVAVGAAGVVDGFAAGAYLGTRWAKRHLKAAVVETEVKASEAVQHVADKVKETVAPVASRPSADAFYPAEPHRHIPAPDFLVAPPVVIPGDGITTGDAFALGQKRAAEGKPR